MVIEIGATTGYILLSILSFIFCIVITILISGIVKERKEELNQVIKVLERESKLEKEIKMIHSYMTTTEGILQKIKEKVETEDEINEIDL